MPWYPLYHADFISDTQAWTAQQVGCLIRLMNHQWANGSVPNNQMQLAAICGVSGAVWGPIWIVLRPKFVTHSRGTMVNKRLAMEYQRQTKKRLQAQSAVRVRWDKERRKKELDTDVHTDTIPSSESESESDSKREASPPLPDGLNLEAWDDWIKFRRQAKMKKYAPVTVKNRTKQLALLPHDRQREIIQYSIDNGYAGLFPDRGGSDGKGLSYIEQVEEETGIPRL